MRTEQEKALSRTKLKSRSDSVPDT